MPSRTPDAGAEAVPIATQPAAVDIFSMNSGSIMGATTQTAKYRYIRRALHNSAFRQHLAAPRSNAMILIVIA